MVVVMKGMMEAVMEGMKGMMEGMMVMRCWW